ncbi:reverse transcriptase [Gossypium australe]|uniref:Reverse transcriptase n=1 Tax=Gossypium australe TaxID=47621 RepID=A0A5B6VSN6_9ROSI|nr:reverse transcriptase [Gossypium australe]
MAWNLLCVPKGMGGLGFRDFHLFNVALLGRQSFTWQSISKAASLLSKGFGWNVGNGRSTDLWKDNWGVEGLSGSSIQVDRRLVLETYVSELIDEDKAEWNEERVTVLYGDYLKDFIQEILPTYDKIARIRSGFYSSCPRCGKERESHIHALRDCPLAKAVLEHGGLDARLLNENFTCCIDWLEAAMRILDKTAMADFITVLWNIWNCRNNRAFQGVEEDSRSSAWKKPEVGVLKINFDVAFQHNKAHFGLVVRDNEGFVLGGRMGKMDKVWTAEWGGLRAMEESINFARLKGWDKVELETDCASIVNRSCNKAVDSLCKLSLKNCCNSDFDMDYSGEVYDIFLKDAIN